MKHTEYFKILVDKSEKVEFNPDHHTAFLFHIKQQQPNRSKDQSGDEKPILCRGSCRRLRFRSEFKTHPNGESYKTCKTCCDNLHKRRSGKSKPASKQPKTTEILNSAADLTQPITGIAQ